MSDLAFWSVGDGIYGKMLRAVAKSARMAGVTDDIHFWTNEPIEWATTHPIGSFNKEHYMFKLEFLKNEVSKLNYKYFAFLDADTWFVRNPGDVTKLMNGCPLHVSLESYCPNPANKRPDWWGAPLHKFEALLRSQGAMSKLIYNCNAGFWIVHKEAINLVHGLCVGFHNYCKTQGIKFTEEAPLSYAMHMLCYDPEPHTLKKTSDTWASDWIGNYKGKLPDGNPWTFEDYFTSEKFIVNPAIVHAMRSKESLIAEGSK